MLPMLLTRFAAACPTVGGSFLGFPTWYEYLDSEVVADRCSLKLAFPADIPKIALAVVEIMLRIGGLVAVGFVIYGGFRYILSQGDVGPGNVPKSVTARHTIVNALIGLVIASLATFIVQLVAKNIK